MQVVDDATVIFGWTLVVSQLFWVFKHGNLQTSGFWAAQSLPFSESFSWSLVLRLIALVVFAFGVVVRLQDEDANWFWAARS